MTRRVAFVSLCEKKSTRAAGLAAVAALAAALLLATPALAAAPQTSLADVEDEVMCPICGTLLQLAESPQAQRQRAFIRRQIGAGKSKAEVKDALVDQYGSAVLALPDGSGFDLSAYLVPAIAFLLAALGLGFGLRRWRRAARPTGSPQAVPPGPQGEDAERLDADLTRYDL